jgi:periplasmic divalent cation tolerance protein
MHLTAYITAKDMGEAKKLADVLLKERLVACSNIISNVESLYWWKGRIAKESEVLLVCKTRRGLEEKIIQRVKRHHSYSVPCVNFLPIRKGNPDFLKWIDIETGKGGKK